MANHCANSTLTPQSLRLHPRILIAFGEVATVLAVLSSRVPKCGVNLLHDLLSPLNARRDQLVSPWASLGSAEQIVSGLHVQTGENCSHDSQHSFTTFVHGRGLYAVRLIFASRIPMLCGRCHVLAFATTFRRPAELRARHFLCHQ